MKNQLLYNKKGSYDDIRAFVNTKNRYILSKRPAKICTASVALGIFPDGLKFSDVTQYIQRQ